VNIGSDEMISINDLAKLVMNIAGKKLSIRNVPGPTGVRGRNSDNQLIQEKLAWRPSRPLKDGIQKTYQWVRAQVVSNVKDALVVEHSCWNFRACIWLHPCAR
jgi:GDP-D-mannose 3',5'-epimerase